MALNIASPFTQFIDPPTIYSPKLPATFSTSLSEILTPISLQSSAGSNNVHYTQSFTNFGLSSNHTLPNPPRTCQNCNKKIGSESRTESSKKQINNEDVFLLQLKTRKLPWKTIHSLFRDEFNKSVEIPALQMRHLRLKRRLKKARALDSLQQDSDVFAFSIPTEMALPVSAKSKF
jgi:hypothetical protein